MATGVPSLRSVSNSILPPTTVPVMTFMFASYRYEADATTLIGVCESKHATHVPDSLSAWERFARNSPRGGVAEDVPAGVNARLTEHRFARETQIGRGLTATR